MDWPPSVVRLALLGLLDQKELDDFCLKYYPAEKYANRLAQVDAFLGHCLSPNPDCYVQLVEDIVKFRPDIADAIENLLAESSYIKSDWLKNVKAL